jgi:hypothetical protein
MPKTSLFTIPLLAGAALLTLVGCSSGTTLPPRLEVRDVASGRTYSTYQPWGQVEKGLGYEFTDIETGKRVTLTNYEIKTLEAQKVVPSESAEAKQFAEAKTRGGVK